MIIDRFFFRSLRGESHREIRQHIRGLASIIVPVLESARVHPALHRRARATYPRPWELIVVDNGSTDGTGDYLAGVQDASRVPVTVIANAANRGSRPRSTKGCKPPRGEYLVLLNNDVVVTDAWLDQLIALANAGTQFTAVAGEESRRAEQPP